MKFCGKVVGMTNSPETATETATDRLMGALIGAGLEVEGVQDTVSADPAALDALNFVQVTLGEALDHLTEKSENRKVHDMTDIYDAEAEADELIDLLGETYIAIGDAEDSLGALATRIELYRSHPSEPTTYDAERHLAAARAALEALAAVLPADGVHKLESDGTPVA